VTYLLERWEINEGLWEMQTGSSSKFGYAAGETISSLGGDGIEMIITLGDTITIRELRSSSSRTLGEHFFTIVELGIDQKVDRGERYEFSFTPDKVGEFTITDSHGDDHGKATLTIVAAGTEIVIEDKPTATPEPTAVPIVGVIGAVDGVYTLERWQIEDGLFELRMGETNAWGYAAGESIQSTAEGGIVMTISLGQTIKFGELRTSTSRSTKDHHFTITELGIDETLIPGARYEFSFTPDQAGTFTIFDSEDPDAHGVATLVVKPAGIEHVLERFQIEDGLFELRVGAAGAFGYAADARINSTEGDGILMTVKLGDTITFTELRTSSSRSTKDHHFTITELGIDERLGPGDRYKFSFTPNRTGTYTIFDSEDPEAHGTATLVVEAPEDSTYLLERFQIEDGVFELRVGAAGGFGYAADARINSTEGDGILMTITLGDIITFTELRTSSSRSTKDHHFTITEFGIDERLGPGDRYEFSFKPDRTGTFTIFDSEDPDAHGTATLVVEAPAEPTYPLERFQIEDGLFQLRVGDAALLGFEVAAQINSTEGDGILMTIKIGETLSFTELRTSSSRSTKNHFFTITEFSINEELDPGERYAFAFTPSRTGTFTIFDSEDPDAHGTTVLVVE